MDSNIINLPPTIDSLYFCGDIHGNLTYISYIIHSKHLHNACIVICGDVGLGFNIPNEKHNISYINKCLCKTNCFVIAIRGNHDNPNCFTDIKLGNSNWINVQDYTIINVCGKNILCIGGGISIDRTLRTPLKTYWENESIQYKPKSNVKVDIIASHEAPNGVYPYVLSQIVLDFAEHDQNLIADITSSRLSLDKVWEDYKCDISHWYYGHYHTSISDFKDGVAFNLLSIEEIKIFNIN